MTFSGRKNQKIRKVLPKILSKNKYVEKKRFYWGKLGVGDSVIK